MQCQGVPQAAPSGLDRQGSRWTQGSSHTTNTAICVGAMAGIVKYHISNDRATLLALHLGEPVLPGLTDVLEEHKHKDKHTPMALCSSGTSVSPHGTGSNKCSMPCQGWPLYDLEPLHPPAPLCCLRVHKKLCCYVVAQPADCTSTVHLQSCMPSTVWGVSLTSLACSSNESVSASLWSSKQACSPGGKGLIECSVRCPLSCFDRVAGRHRRPAVCPDTDWTYCWMDRCRQVHKQCSSCCVVSAQPADACEWHLQRCRVGSACCKSCFGCKRHDINAA